MSKVKVTGSNFYIVNTRINILQWILVTLLRTKYVSSVVKIHWRMLILECSQRCYAVKHLTRDLDLWHWPWKSIGFQILLRTNNILQYILTKFGTYLVLRRIWNHIDFQGHMSKVKVTGSNFYIVNSRINILQWILVKLGTYLVFKRIWNTVYFQGQRSRLPGQIILPCNILVNTPEENKGNAKRGVSPRLKIWPSDLENQ
jgi:hypothetical protein